MYIVYIHISNHTVILFWAYHLVYHRGSLTGFSCGIFCGSLAVEPRFKGSGALSQEAASVKCDTGSARVRGANLGRMNRTEQVAPKRCTWVWVGVSGFPRGFPNL